MITGLLEKLNVFFREGKTNYCEILELSSYMKKVLLNAQVQCSKYIFSMIVLLTL